MDAFCCETYKGLGDAFKALVKREAKKLPPLLRGPYVSFADSLENFCPVCGKKISQQSIGSVKTTGSATSPTEHSRLDGRFPTVSKDEYKGEVPFDKIPENAIICPSCKGSGKKGMEGTIPIACMVCLGQGTLNGESEKARALRFIKGTAKQISELAKNAETGTLDK